jgi:hypothetical protein
VGHKQALQQLNNNKQQPTNCIMSSSVSLVRANLMARLWPHTHIINKRKHTITKGAALGEEGVNKIHRQVKYSALLVTREAHATYLIDNRLVEAAPQKTKDVAWALHCPIGLEEKRRVALVTTEQRAPLDGRLACSMRSPSPPAAHTCAPGGQ